MSDSSSVVSLENNTVFLSPHFHVSHLAFCTLQILLAADACLFTAFYEHHRDMIAPYIDKSGKPRIFWYLPKKVRTVCYLMKLKSEKGLQRHQNRDG